MNLQKQEVANILDSKEIVKDGVKVEWIETVDHHYNASLNAYEPAIIFKYNDAYYKTSGFIYRHVEEADEVEVECISKDIYCFKVEQKLKPTWVYKTN